MKWSKTWIFILILAFMMSNSAWAAEQQNDVTVPVSGNMASGNDNSHMQDNEQQVQVPGGDTGDLSGNHLPEIGVSGNAVSENSISSNLLQPEVIRVKLPSKTSFMMDPMDMFGFGSVFSPDYTVYNYSNRDIEFEISSIDCTFANDADFVASTEPFDAENEKQKVSYLMLRMAEITGYEPETAEDGKGIDGFNREYNRDINTPMENDIIITDTPTVSVNKIILKAAEYDENNEFVRLNEGSVASFQIMGQVSALPDIAWHPGDVNINIVYSWKAVKPEHVVKELLEVGQDSLSVSQNGISKDGTAVSGNEAGKENQGTVSDNNHGQQGTVSGNEPNKDVTGSNNGDSIKPPISSNQLPENKTEPPALPEKPKEPTGQKEKAPEVVSGNHTYS